MEILATIFALLVTIFGWHLNRRNVRLRSSLDRETANLKTKLDQETSRLDTALQEEVEARKRHETRGDLAKDIAIDEIGNIVGSLAKIAGRADDLPQGKTLRIPIPSRLREIVKIETAE